MRVGGGNVRRAATPCGCVWLGAYLLQAGARLPRRGRASPSTHAAAYACCPPTPALPAQPQPFRPRVACAWRRQAARRTAQDGSRYTTAPLVTAPARGAPSATTTGATPMPQWRAAKWAMRRVAVLPTPPRTAPALASCGFQTCSARAARRACRTAPPMATGKAAAGEGGGAGGRAGAPGGERLCRYARRHLGAGRRQEVGGGARGKGGGGEARFRAVGLCARIP